MKKSTILLVTCVLLATASFGQGKKLKRAYDSWLGHSKDELVQGFGIPNKDYNSGSIELLEYDTYYNAFNGTPRVKQIVFIINSAGNVSSWKYYDGPSAGAHINVN